MNISIHNVKSIVVQAPVDYRPTDGCEFFSWRKIVVTDTKGNDFTLNLCNTGLVATKVG